MDPICMKYEPEWKVKGIPINCACMWRDKLCRS